MLVALVILLGPLAGKVPSESPYEGDWHLERRPVQDVEVAARFELEAPQLKPRRWWVVAGAIPKLPAQEPVPDGKGSEIRIQSKGSWKTGAVRTEAGSGSRTYLWGEIDAEESTRPDGFVSEATYRARLFARRLAKGPASPPPPLSEQERSRYLVPTSSIDSAAPSLRRWMEEKRLAKKDVETPLVFAYRAFDAVRSSFTYQGPPLWCASKGLERGYGDCGDLSLILTAVLRANGVPARLNAGAWVVRDGPGEPEWHVRMEFWDDRIGWIPIDGAGAVQWGRRSEEAFGRDEGNFLATHLDTHLRVDTGVFGVRELVQLQSAGFFAAGSGSFEGQTMRHSWTVARRPIHRE